VQRVKPRATDANSPFVLAIYKKVNTRQKTGRPADFLLLLRTFTSLILDVPGEAWVDRGMEPNTVVIITFAGYLVLLLAIGWWGERRFGKGYAGFVAADHSLGAWVTAISAAASSESAWVMLGLSGLGWKHGLGAYWAAGGCAFGFIITSLWVVRQLRASAGRYKVLTLGDYFAEHLGAGNPRAKSSLRVVSSLLICFFLTVYVVAQFTGAGKQMNEMGLMSYSGGVLIGAAIVGIYVLLGGYAAVCWTDTIQGLLMGAVMLILPAYGLIKAGGFAAIGEMLQANNIGSFWVGGQGPTSEAIGFALTYFGFSLGYPGMPHSVIRYITVKDQKEASRAAWIGAIYGTLILFGSASFGLIARAFVTTLTDHEGVLPAFTSGHMPPIIGGVILAAVSAAMMSTADSQLMVSATSLIHDIWYKVIRRRQETPADRRMVISTRVILGVMTLAALALALMKPRVIDTIVLFAWGCLGSAFSPVILLSIYWRRFTWQGALGAMVTGPLFIVIWQGAGFNSIVHGLIPGTLVSTFAAILLSLLSPAATPREVQ